VHRILTVERLGLEMPSDRLRLDFDRRNRRRIVLETQAGERLLLDMPTAIHLRGGDALRLDDGRLMAVEAADEPLLDITAASSAALVRIAWHLGNRHLPTQLLPGDDGGTLRIRADHVIAAMAEGLGGRCTTLAGAFDPEGGAYAHEVGGRNPGHAHGNGHDRHHTHAPD
jgi:urease accessory protein